MARNLALTRDEAEWLVDLLEDCDPVKVGSWRHDIATELRELFGMVGCGQEKILRKNPPDSVVDNIARLQCERRRWAVYFIDAIAQVHACDHDEFGVMAGKLCEWYDLLHLGPIPRSEWPIQFNADTGWEFKERN